MNDEQLKKTLEEHEARILALEALFKEGNSKVVNKEASEPKDYSGPKGGVLLLVDRGFFKEKQSADAVCTELAKDEYVYKKVVVQTALRRLSIAKGPLVKIEEACKQVYVQRK